MTDASSLRPMCRVFVGLALFALCGCASMHFPLVADASYPAGWPAVGSAAARCRAVTGDYVNAGVLAAEDGNEVPILLSNLLDLPVQSGRLLLEVSSVGGGDVEEHVAQCRLEVVPAGNEDARVEVPSCFCGGGTLAVLGRNQGGAAAPFGIFGGQTNLWLSVGVDGSLVVLREEATGGIVFVLPFYFVRRSWGRLERAVTADMQIHGE